MQIQGSRDCGNSPKNRFVQDFAIAIETGDVLPDRVSETIVWEGAFQKPVMGSAAFDAALKRRKAPQAITVEHAISHGKVGAACGTVLGADGQERRFAHVFEFTNTKANCVAVIRTYA